MQMIQERLRTWFLLIVLTLVGTVSLNSCSSHEDDSSERRNIKAIADKVWTFSQSHPDGFTLNIRTMTEPTEGIAVSYAAPQNSYSRSPLHKVDQRALTNDGNDGVRHHIEERYYY